MATAIQLLRSAVPYLRPDPSVLADGMPMVNLAPEEPGMYLRLTNGALVKIGPTHIGSSAPNSTPTGFSGNAVGELWIDNTDPDKVILKAWNGSSWDQVRGGSETETGPNPPAGPDPGDQWFDTANGVLNYWDGTQWIPITNTPAAGSNSEVQFNDSGDFGSSSTFTFSTFEDKLNVNNFNAALTGSIEALTCNTANMITLTSVTGDFTGAVTGTNVDLSGTLTANFGVFNQSITAESLVSNTSVTAVDGIFSNNVTITNQVMAKDASISNQLTAKIGTFTDKVDVTNAVTAGSFAIHTLSALPAPTP